MIRRLIVPALAIAVALTFAACSDGAAPSTAITALKVTGSAPAKGATSQLTAVATYGDGTTKDVTSGSDDSDIVTWTSTNNAIATVTSTGLVTGIANGTVQVVVMINGFTTTYTITIGG